MCGTCGCAEPGGPDRVHAHHQGQDDGHPHGRSDDGAPPTERRLTLELDLLAENAAIAERNRRRFAQAGTLVLNLVSSPGAGKTTLLVRTIGALAPAAGIAVITGDQSTSHDAERIGATGVPVAQINTGAACHLDAAMIERALDRLPAEGCRLLFIENVGNLVCPAAFDLGEAAKVVIASVTEGEDKPLKYPGMFRAAAAVLISKCDLLPHLRVDADRLIAHARRVNPAIDICRIAAESEGGLADWLAWLEGVRSARPAP